MIYQYFIPIIPETYFKTYVAKIYGEDPKYRFKREFLERTTDVADGKRWYYYQIGRGIFEVSIKRYKKGTKEMISSERKWFVYYRRNFYEIDYTDVLFCVFNLKLQCGKKRVIYAA